MKTNICQFSRLLRPGPRTGAPVASVAMQNADATASAIIASATLAQYACASFSHPHCVDRGIAKPLRAVISSCRCSGSESSYFATMICAITLGSAMKSCASPILDHGLRTSSGESLTTAGSTVRRPRQRDGVARPIRVLMCNPGCVGFQRLRPTWAATDLYAAWRHLYVCWSPPTHGIDTISEFFDGFVVRGRVAGESFSRNKWHRPTL